MSTTTWTAADQRQLLSDRDRFLALFRDEAQHRNARSTWREPGVLEWMVREREVMWDLVDRLRRGRCLGPVPMTAVERVESNAAGHIDYADKFALYCAELACGLRDENGRHREVRLDR